MSYKLDIEKIRDFINNKDNVNKVYDMIIDINGYNNSLDYLYYYRNNQEFFDTFFYYDTLELLRAVEEGEYNYRDEYVKINQFGGLISGNIYDIYDDYILYIDEIIEAIEYIFNNEDGHTTKKYIIGSISYIEEFIIKE